MEKQREIVIGSLSPDDRITWEGLKRAGLAEAPPETDPDVLDAAGRSPIVNTARLVRRNEVCPGCASGKKFKHCCGAPRVCVVRGENGRTVVARPLVRPSKRRDQK